MSKKIALKPENLSALRWDKRFPGELSPANFSISVTDLKQVVPADK